MVPTIKGEISHINGSETSWKAILACQNELLGMIAQGLSTKAILDNLVLLFEQRFPGALCSLILVEEDDAHIRPGASPHMPDDYIQAIDGSPIGPSAGPCGTAIYRKTPVFVSDISRDPLWDNYKDIAFRHGLRSCGQCPSSAPALRYWEPLQFTIMSLTYFWRKSAISLNSFPA